MKNQGSSQGWIYLHLNTAQDFAMSSGIDMKDFYRALSDRLHHLLLLKHKFEQSSFNMHTYLEYVHEQEVSDLVKEDIAAYGEFCWIDFEDEAGVDEMSAQELAELLYMGHMKYHLNLPFYKKLNNRFVYLSTEDGMLNRTYYKEWTDFFLMIGKVIPEKIAVRKNTKLLQFKKEKALSPIPKEVVMKISHLLREGVVISFQHSVINKGKVEVPVWVSGDYANMDDLQDDMQKKYKREPSAVFSYDRKTKEWSAG
ncbi:hypothetical protein KP77_06550 [Jeotgalibacillus alimentarius]|uniref:Uncharacterized protein n=1 Tax=Jeotgalibacillus alimentarius TaxID=135826 RepID=A0A0C2RQ46_9BACL|nr:hypothetical protein [Jeotgalibacillus alimentarius]KIL52395.1 hypothetical protein KP77_06550 [Jeotgalibacillus alimentarius]